MPLQARQTGHFSAFYICVCSWVVWFSVLLRIFSKGKEKGLGKASQVSCNKCDDVMFEGPHQVVVVFRGPFGGTHTLVFPVGRGVRNSSWR